MTPDTIAKLAKLIPMLSSENDGEVVAAARAIGRVLKAGGSDWHALAKALVAAAPAPPPPPPQQRGRNFEDDLADDLRQAWSMGGGTISPEELWRQMRAEMDAAVAGRQGGYYRPGQYGYDPGANTATAETLRRAEERRVRSDAIRCAELLIGGSMLSADDEAFLVDLKQSLLLGAGVSHNSMARLRSIWNLYYPETTTG